MLKKELAALGGATYERGWVTRVRQFPRKSFTSEQKNRSRASKIRLMDLPSGRVKTTPSECGGFDRNRQTAYFGISVSLSCAPVFKN